MPQESVLLEGERLDDLERNGLKIIQNPKFFCFGMDAVLLAHFVGGKENGRFLDLCTGNGILPILLSALIPGGCFDGIELQPILADMAKRSVAYNGLGERVSVTCGDIKDGAAIYGASSFDVITANPPYMIGGHGLVGENATKMLARHEIACTLSDVLSVTAELLVPKGRCYFVHRPFRLTELLGGMHEMGIEPKRMRLVYPFIDKEPNMVLVEGVRGGKARLTVEKPLIVYDSPGVYTDEVMRWYRF